MPSRDDIRSLSTEQRWIPPSTVRRDALTHSLTPESRNDLIFRKVRGILNKLTPEKFAKLSNDLLNVELNSHVILKGVIFLVCILNYNILQLYFNTIVIAANVRCLFGEKYILVGN